jgi:hypothetical protein
MSPLVAEASAAILAATSWFVVVARVYMDVPHSNPGYSWHGESGGHYENGDSLVMDAIGLDDKGPIDRFRTPHTKQLHVVELFKLTNGGKKFEVLVHVEDLGTFLGRPGEIRTGLRRSHKPLGRRHLRRGRRWPHSGTGSRAGPQMPPSVISEPWLGEA